MGTVILRVTASDADSGNFALIEYSLGDGEGKFAIHPNTVSRPWEGLTLGVGKPRVRPKESPKAPPHPVSESCLLDIFRLQVALSKDSKLSAESQVLLSLQPLLS